jgi:nucleotide-binding universal stress UspA family protein
MTTFLVGTDGSDLAIRAAVEGLSLTRPPDKVLLVAVADLLDSSLAEDATGHAAASMTPDELDSHNQRIIAEGRAAAEKTAEALRNLPSMRADFDTLVTNGDPGPALCRLAADVGASAVIVGSRGRGGLKRALLGSVSDYVVRHAPCSVIVSREG